MSKTTNLPEVVKECVFQSPYDQYKEFNGKKCTILGAVDPKTYDFEECGELFRARMENGEEIEALPEELGDENGKHVYCRVCSEHVCKECSLTGK